MKKVVIVGGGFAGLNAAKKLGNAEGIEVTLIDARNFHLFQPLLYQVAMAALSPADIASPIRSLLSRYRNIEVIQGKVEAIVPKKQVVRTATAEYAYDYLLLACGAQHSYFGNETWEPHAPGLKTLEQATEIRRRVLDAFEKAEIETDKDAQKTYLTFVIVGGGPTGVELAGAIGEMSRFTLARDFRKIDPKLTRIMLIEGGERILAGFPKKLSSLAMRDLEKLGVQVWTSSLVTKVDADGVTVGSERVQARTVLWAAGVKASPLGQQLGTPTDALGRVIVEKDLSIPGFSHIFVAGDQANFSHHAGKPLPGMAPVAMQQGRFIAQRILREIRDGQRPEFQFVDKGIMATIGRSSAICKTGKLEFGGFLGWAAWLLIHIYYLSGFKNRLFVTINWAWSYLTFRRGARLIINKEWRSFPEDTER